MTVANEILLHVMSLDETRQRLVLDYVRAISRPRPEGSPPEALLKHVGSIPPDVLDQMEQAINERFEHVDPEPDVKFDDR
jgi:hypothetical protein